MSQPENDYDVVRVVEEAPGRWWIEHGEPCDPAVSGSVDPFTIYGPYDYQQDALANAYRYVSWEDYPPPVVVLPLSDTDTELVNDEEIDVD